MASFKVGSRGICVRELQELLHIGADGAFGKKQTDPAVRAAQKAHGLAETGEADEALYAAMGVAFPSLFQRCLTVTNSFEGTYYGDCNETDIDNAGLTMGIIGFTSAHGEVQRILIEYSAANPAMLNAFAGQRRVVFQNLLATNPDRLVWDRFFYGPGYDPTDSIKDAVLDDVVAAFATWGNDPKMRDIQLAHAKDKYWAPVSGEVVAFGFDKGSAAEQMAAHALLFDIHVQNGSVKSVAREEFKQRDDDPNRPQRDRMLILAEAVANASNPKWKHDVLERKSMFARGAGVVHGASYSLDAQALA